MFEKDLLGENVVRISGDGSAQDGCCDRCRPLHA